MPCQCPAADIGGGRGRGLVVVFTVSETGGAGGSVTWHRQQGLPEGLPLEETPCQAPGLGSGRAGELRGHKEAADTPGLSRARAAVRRNQGPWLPPLLPVSALPMDLRQILLRPAASAELCASRGCSLISPFDEPSGGEWEGWASSVGVAVGCPVAELAGRTPGLGHTQVPAEAQLGLWKTAWLRTVVQASPPWRP